MGAARSFYDFQYLIEVLEREAVNLGTLNPRP